MFNFRCVCSTEYHQETAPIFVILSINQPTSDNWSLRWTITEITLVATPNFWYRVQKDILLTGCAVLVTLWLSQGVSRSQTYTCPPQVSPSTSDNSVGDENAMILDEDIVQIGRTTSESVELGKTHFIDQLSLRIAFWSNMEDFKVFLSSFWGIFLHILRNNKVTLCLPLEVRWFTF